MTAIHQPVELKRQISRYDIISLQSRRVFNRQRGDKIVAFIMRRVILIEKIPEIQRSKASHSCVKMGAGESAASAKTSLGGGKNPVQNNP